MNPTAEELERTLCPAYREALSLYVQALETAENAVTSSAPGQEPDGWLQKVQESLEQAHRVEQTVAAPRRQWLELGARPGPGFRRLLDQLVSTVARLNERIGQAEQVARAEQARLAPALEAAARGRQMRHAYGQVSALGRRPRGDSGPA
jgi:hypothetical protein